VWILPGVEPGEPRFAVHFMNKRNKLAIARCRPAAMTAAAAAYLFYLRSRALEFSDRKLDGCDLHAGSEP
jgi:hypothetical protein